MYLGQNIKHLRSARKIGQEALATYFTIKRTTLSNWETGKSNPNLEETIKIANYFGVTLDDLLTKDLSVGETVTIPKPNGKNSVLFIKNIDASGGSLSLETTPSMEGDTFALHIAGARPGSICMSITGNSMSPELPEGDMAIGVLIEREHIKPRTVCIVETLHDGYTVKLVTIQGKEILMESFNSNFKPYKYPLTGVKRFFEVYMKLTNVR